VREQKNTLTFSTIVIAAFAGLAGFALLFFIGGAVASLLAGPLHISLMEGAQGYFAIAVGMIAGLVGFIGALWFVLRRRGIRGGKIAIGGAMALGIIILSTASAVGIWYAMQPRALNVNGPEPILRLEVRAPEGQAADVLRQYHG
jgi:hypothetical protein